MQKNLFSKKEYNGENELLLEMIKLDQGYKSDYWCTFYQARENGFKVKKGSKSVPLKRVVHFEDNKNKKTKSALNYFRVFNEDCLEEV